MVPSSFTGRSVARRALAQVRAGLFATSLSFAGAQAGAQSFSVGVAAGAADGRVECIDIFPCDRSGNSWKVTGAWRFATPFDVQLAAFGAAKYKGGDRTALGTPFGGDFSIEGIGVTAGYWWSFAPRWNLVGRIGGASVRTKFDYAPPFSGSRSKTELEPLAGLGVAFDVTPQLRVGIDYDETRFKAHTRHGSLRMLGAAAQYSF